MIRRIDMKIVIIEDDPDAVENYRLLKKHHSVSIYTDAEGVITDLNEVVKKDIIILDIMMELADSMDPEEAKETGIALYQRIRAKNKKVPILVISARSRSELLQAFPKDTKLNIVEKPIDLETLRRSIAI